MEALLGFLLGTLQLFYPLLIVSIVMFIYAIFVRSWILMLISGLLIFPDVWYFSGYPPYPYVIFLPVIHILLAILFYRGKMKVSSE
jgi:hypothetical protein